MRFSTWSSSLGRRRAGRGFATFGSAARGSAVHSALALAHEIRPAAVGRAKAEVFPRYDVVRHGVEDSPVVRDEKDGSRKRLERRLERLAALEVEVIRRLVEHEEVRPGRDDERQREPPSLAARRAR